MGNTSSTGLNIKENELSLKQLNESNAEFLTKLNEIATNYILGQNFQDMIRLTNSKYCDDLVIITSKILKKSYSAEQIQYAYKKMFNNSDEAFIEGELQRNTKSPMFLNRQDIELGDLIDKEQKKKMCIDIAKYYVKIAHLFAAIITTLNPVFSWRTSASSSRAILKPFVSEKNTDQSSDQNLNIDLNTDLGKDISETTSETNSDIINDMTDLGITPKVIDKNDSVVTSNPVTKSIESVESVKPVEHIEHGEEFYSLSEPKDEDITISEPNSVMKDMDGGEGDNTDDINEEIGYATLENKQYIPSMVKEVKVENLNFCNSRIADLIDMDEIVDLVDGKNLIPGQTIDSTIKIKTKLCSSNLNNNNEGYSRTKTVYDLPGFAELSRLYYDKYNVSKGRFDRMSSESENEKKRNVALLYTLFTGNRNPPKDIRSFKDIPLHSFNDTIECDNPESLFNKTYIGTTKDKLFIEYVEQIKKMIFESNMIRNSLLEIIDRVFIVNPSSASAPSSPVLESPNKDESVKTKFIIDPNLTYDDLDTLIVDARRIILNLYITCEKDFIKALKILQAIIEGQILETSQRQVKELEREIENAY
jgi:hypothetical protein